MQYRMCLNIYTLKTSVTKLNRVTNMSEDVCVHVCMHMYTHMHTQRETAPHILQDVWVGNAGAKVLGIAMMLSTMKDVLQQLERK